MIPKFSRGFLFISILLFPFLLIANDGYDLWLNYRKIENKALLDKYNGAFNDYYIKGNSETLKAAENELKLAFSGLLGTEPKLLNSIENGCIVLATKNESVLKGHISAKDYDKLGNEGFIIKSVKINNRNCTLISANTDIGVLYGVFHFIKLIQTQQIADKLTITEVPRLDIRALNHWDNLDGSIERGYAGNSLWKWDELPNTIDKRYIDYARANASIGINATVLNNVNSNPKILTKDYLEKVKALADVFRPYGLKVYLSVSFTSPIKLGGLPTADPLNPQVIDWWEAKAKEIYTLIPDFGGFLVKANSEGQPGPQDYGRTHADGANMLAQALESYKGVVMWRAFVYNSDPEEDRVLQAYNSFKPLDSQFKDNVLVQIKNGPIDFQPREPFSPLFGAMPNTSLMMEFQITQEYLGFSNHLVFLSTLYEETLDSDTYAKGKGSTVSNVIEGKYSTKKLTGMAGVSNIGNSRNWCGHPFAQSNWYSLGRLAWNSETSSESIAEDWIRMTFSNNKDFIEPVKKMMLESRETTVDYMTPLGLNHIMAYNTHRGPGPWVDTAAQPNWKSTYYHRADSIGIGFDRTTGGSNAVSQYFPPVRDRFNSLETCPENLLLWFHHVSWKHKMKSGNTLWDEMCLHYYNGVDKVREMQSSWNKLKSFIDEERFIKVKQLLEEQEVEAVIWRNSCVLYFQTFSKMPIPEELEKPEKSLSYYIGLKLE
ncbi:alpha-glucuronidase [Flavobacterium alkalisoli]|uniref:Xylan alpha-1,2-glucuronidase n=1 Tax=Flavobacterium alkalisoli TaxID=2602769 RepID=A0A5B9FUJ4_9FLAO|nr:alpha-glucuronidase family glycosyl hydrolase [Flavobacterium alkalisoli]QEE50993.1 alpha-glucuronidase [Flavobacterium alkalisoli]